MQCPSNIPSEKPTTCWTSNGANRQLVIKVGHQDSKSCFTVIVNQEERAVSGVALLKIGLHHPWVGNLYKGISLLKDPRHPMTPRNMTDDVSNCITRWCMWKENTYTKRFLDFFKLIKNPIQSKLKCISTS